MTWCLTLEPRLAVMEGGPVPDSPDEAVCEAPDWIDRTHGPVDTSDRSAATPGD